MENCEAGLEICGTYIVRVVLFIVGEFHNAVGTLQQRVHNYRVASTALFDYIVMLSTKDIHRGFVRRSIRS
jgi:hypothetical protein